MAPSCTCTKCAQVNLHNTRLREGKSLLCEWCAFNLNDINTVAHGYTHIATSIGGHCTKFSKNYFAAHVTMSEPRIRSSSLTTLTLSELHTTQHCAQPSARVRDPVLVSIHLCDLMLVSRCAVLDPYRKRCSRMGKTHKKSEDGRSIRDYRLV